MKRFGVVAVTLFISGCSGWQFQPGLDNGGCSVMVSRGNASLLYGLTGRAEYCKVSTTGECEPNLDIKALKELCEDLD